MLQTVAAPTKGAATVWSILLVVVRECHCNLCNFDASNGTDALLGARGLLLQNLNPTAILSRSLLRRAAAIAGELSSQREKTRALLFVFGFWQSFQLCFHSIN